MKTVYKKIVERSTILLMAAGLTFTISSCRDDDDGPTAPTVTTSTYKMTVTIPLVDGSDYVSIATSGGTANPQESDLWKLNGVLQNGQKVVGLNADSFQGATKTYVLESTKPLVAVASGFQVINSQQPMSVNYKLEKNGTVVVNENFTLAAGESKNKDYNY